MHVTFRCRVCGAHLEADAEPFPAEDCGGGDGFYSIDTQCPRCGHTIETVIKQTPEVTFAPQIQGTRDRIATLEHALIESERQIIWNNGYFKGSWDETEQVAKDALKKKELL